jgi:hypothetical protein
MASRIPTIRHGDIVLVTLTTADPFEGRAVACDVRAQLNKRRCSWRANEMVWC